MKNKLKYIIVAFLAIGMYSCDDEEYSLEGADIGGNSILKDSKISVFDTNEDLKIELITANGITVSSLDINKEGSKIADASINGTSATFSSSSLGTFLFGDDLDETTGSFSIDFLSTLSNGQTYTNDYSVKVAHAIEMDEEQASVKYMDTTSQIVSFSTFTKYATIDNLKVEWKKGKLGTYAEDSNYSFDDDNMEIELNDMDYINDYNLIAGDTLYYKFTATSGALTDFTETSIAIKAQLMSGATTGLVSSTSTEYNFTNKEAKDGEIEFVSPLGFTVIAPAAMELEFVEITLPAGVSAGDYFSTGDIADAKTQFNNGPTMISTSNLTKDMLYAYKIIRIEKDADDENVNQTYYGLLKISDIVLTNPNSHEEVNFDFKEGHLIGE